MAQRLNAFDLAELAADVGPNPRSIGVVIELDGAPPDDDSLRRLMMSRLAQVPRLSQCVVRDRSLLRRLRWIPVAVDLAFHLRHRTALAGDLLDVAAGILSEPWDPRRPMWTMTVVSIPDSGHSALVWSSHHVLADGPSILRALLLLVQDDALSPGPGSPPRDGPPEPQLGSRPPPRPRSVWGRGEPGISWRLIPRTSVNQPVTPGYALRTVEVGLGALHRGARSCGATINDALLWSWGQAVRNVLREDGQGDARIVVSSMVTRPTGEIGNRVGSFRVPVPVRAEPDADSLSRLAGITRSHKRRIAGWTWWLTAQFFRALAACGQYRRFVERQRSITTMLTNMRGPLAPPAILGRRVIRAIPLAPLVGNVTTMVAALSCEERLVVSVLCSPESAEAIDRLAQGVREELLAVCGFSSQ